MHRWPRGVDQVLFAPAAATTALHRELAPRGELARRVRRPAGAREGARAARPRRPAAGRPARAGRRRARGGAGCAALLPDAVFLGVLHGDELARAYATLDVFVHTGRHETYCQSAQEALASGVPVVAPRVGRADRRRRRHRRGLPLRARRRRRAGPPRRAARHPPGAPAPDGGRRPAERARADLAGGQRAARRPLPRRQRTRRTSSARRLTVGLTPRRRRRPRRRCRRGARASSIARPRASACSSGQTGSSSVQCAPTDEHHRRDRRLVGVVVLAGVLEDLLHGAAGAGEEDDAGVADLEQQRLARGVAEVLRDRGREQVGRLVAVVPGRDAQRLAGRRGWRRPPRTPASAQAPMLGRKDGTRATVASAPARSPGTKAPRLAASIAPGPPPVATVWCAPSSWPSRAASAYVRRPALDRVPAHHADDVAVADPVGHRRVDLVVVQRPRERVVGGGRAARPGVRARVEAVVVARACRRARAASRAWCGRGRPGCRGSRAARSRPRGVRRRRPRRRTRSRGTATAPATARAAPDRAR